MSGHARGERDMVHFSALAAFLSRLGAGRRDLLCVLRYAGLKSIFNFFPSTAETRRKQHDDATLENKADSGQRAAATITCRSWLVRL